MLFSNRILRIIFCLILYCVNEVSLSSCSYENERIDGLPCQYLGVSGTCKKLDDCKIALYAISKRRSHNLCRCGFEGNDEVVCCPGEGESLRSPEEIKITTKDPLTIWGKVDTTPPIVRVTNSSKRKCVTECEKIYKQNNITPEIEYHVLNGEDAKIGQFPHIAALGYRDEYGTIDWRKCGASLISSRFLLSAAHCSVCQGCYDPVKARFGVIDVRDDARAQDIDIKSVIVFESYNPSTKHNDISLIELVKDVDMSKTVYPACLYVESDDPAGLRVAGWGQTNASKTDSRSYILQYAVIEPVATNQCNITILTKSVPTTLKTIVNTQICATSKSSDACPGDSGGPLQILTKAGGYDIVGVVSYGITTCGTTTPGIYTRVSAYLDWIEERVWPT